MFISVDPLAEEYYDTYPYAYCGGDPVNAVDPTGKSTWWTTDDPEQIEAYWAWFSQNGGGNTGSYNFGNANWGSSSFTFEEYQEAIQEGKGITHLIHDRELGHIPMMDPDPESEIEKTMAMGSVINYQYAYFEDGEHLIGPILIGLGQPIKALKPIGALGSKPGSSIASYTLSKVFPQKFTDILGDKAGRKVAKYATSNTIGRALGRFVPGMGWILLGFDVITTSWELGAEYGPINNYLNSKKVYKSVLLNED